ncbi:MAG TPA: protein phosphatase 2C domain-containing protein [Ktedonobacterales bacterium]
MLCQQCGAELRPGARFCNVCGARQNASEPEQAPVTTGAELEEGAGRAKRPPRVPRASDEATQAHGDVSTLPIMTDLLPGAGPDNEGSATPNDAEPLIPDAELRDFMIQPSDSEHSASSGSSVGDVEDQDTAERAIPLAGSNGAATIAPAVRFDMPPLAELTRAGESDEDTGFPLTRRVGPDDALPWPLPPQMIVGGRYRVGRLIPGASADPERENQYIVADLQGYERCWSCGETYGAEAATDQFCQKCGADMLAREYIMTERAIADGETTPGEGAVAAEPSVTDQEASPDEAAGQLEDQESGEAPEASSPPPDVREFTQGKRSYRVEPRVIAPPAFPLGARVEVAMATDVGRTREGEHNEDSASALALTLAHDSRMRPLALGLVADGLGGHANGQDASRLVARTITEHIMGMAAAPMVSAPTGALTGESGLEAALLEAARAANTRLCAENARTGADMGSTLVAALVYDDTAYIVNAGDSRAYVFDGDGLRRITTDHSLVEQLIQSGLVTPEERYTHPKRNQIFRSLGDDPHMQMDLFVQRLKPGMRLLLCSDGLWEMARDEQITEILRQTLAPREACDALVRAANENGGEDNITAVLLDVTV